MSGEIFISYRRSDEAWARLLHDQLRAEGVDSWYDAKIGAGQDWRSSTAKALEASQIFVLLFSAKAAQSDEIAKELAAATHEKKLIIPVRLENIAPKGTFLYELASRNWINAYENTEVTLAKLAKGLAHLVRTGAQDESGLPYERTAERGQPAPRRKLSRPVLFGVAVAAIAGFAATAWLLWSVPKPVAGAVPAPSHVSLAVLPFVNLSGDAAQEFFSDGMTEEITAALAKVANLKVVGRTSAFQFKTRNRDLRAIGRALGASVLIEGSVRKDGNQLRITAHLVRAADGTDMWTDTYDRELKSVFAVQEDIAKAIAAALQIPLGLKPGESLISSRTTDTQAYQDYLRALTLYRARNILKVIEVLEPMVRRDRDYAPAWALLAEAYTFEPLFLPGSTTIGELRSMVQAAFAKADHAARQAIQFDPDYAPGYAALADLEANRSQWAEADGNFHKALALDPTDPDTLYLYATALNAEGRLKQSLTVRKTVRSLEPFVPIYGVYTAFAMQLNGDLKGTSILEALPSVGPVGSQRDNYLALAYALQGKYALAAQTLLQISPMPPSFLMPANSVALAADILRNAPAKITAAGLTPASQSEVAWVYAFVGAPERLLDHAEDAVEAGIGSRAQVNMAWHPSFRAARKTERFKALVRKLGLVDYWRKHGWPDLCRPVGTDDFACS
jgi:TolB-like protein